MPLELTQLNQLIERPSESLSLELKDWIDPDSNEGKAKIIKAALAMRNNDGGYLLIGFHNNDGTPNIAEAPDNVSELFHVDKIQGYITRHSSEPFEIFVYYPEIENKNFVVIEIPQGVKTPVASKSGLVEGKTHYVHSDKVYVRTLNANNTPSTAEAKWQDWPRIVEKCFDNREADVGRFVRRHLSSSSTQDLKEAFLSLFKGSESEASSNHNVLMQFLDYSFSRYEVVVSERAIAIPKHGSMEVAVLIDGKINEFAPNREFLNLISATNPGYTGWPVWVDSRSFTETAHRPFIFDGAWEAFIASFGGGFSDHLDYWRISPDGQFYLYRAFQDDVGATERAPQPGTVLDFGLAILRAAECMAVALAFAKAMGCDEAASIKIAYRWNGLQKRVLSSWANPGRYLSYDRTAYQDEVVTTVDVPVDTAPGALAGYVHKIISKLFEVFDGFELSSEVTEDLVRRLVERRL